MPVAHLKTNVILAPEAAKALALKLSALMARVLGKPEDYVLASVGGGKALVFGGTADPAALVRCGSLGLEPKACRSLTRELCAFLEAELGISPARVFVDCVSLDPAMFGWKNETFS